MALSFHDERSGEGGVKQADTMPRMSPGVEGSLRGAEPEAAILVHGLWMRPWVMGFLARRLRQRGFRVWAFAYRSVRGGLAENAQALARFAASVRSPVLHFVGHSLGGLLILRMLLESGPSLPPGRVVVLGSPLTGSAVARRISGVPGLRQALGHAAEVLDPGIECLPAQREVGAIAGTATLGLGRLFAHLEPPHDGTVSVAETRSDGLADHLELPVSHTGLVLSKAVADAVARFLRHGRFRD